MKSPKSLLVLLFLAVLLLSACNPLSETREKQYKDYHALVKADEIQRGWAPEFLPTSTTNIHLKYNLDSNTVLLAFDYAPEDADAMTASCTPIGRFFPPRQTADWWPDDLTTDSSDFYECPEGYLALREGQGYYWVGVKAPADVIPAASLYLHPDKYQQMDGRRVTVIGYVWAQ
jgi:hypothetical protein